MTVSQLKEQLKSGWNPQSMGKKGGKYSVRKRFKGKSKKEISEIMKNIRRGLKQGGIIDEELVKDLIKYGKEAGLF